MCTNTDFMAECFLTVQQNLRIKQVILTGNNTFFFSFVGLHCVHCCFVLSLMK